MRYWFPKCVWGCTTPVVGKAYGQPVCAKHLALCIEISNAERREWRQKQAVHVIRPEERAA